MILRFCKLNYPNTEEIQFADVVNVSIVWIDHHHHDLDLYIFAGIGKVKGDPIVFTAVPGEEVKEALREDNLAELLESYTWIISTDETISIRFDD